MWQLSLDNAQHNYSEYSYKITHSASSVLYMTLQVSKVRRTFQSNVILYNQFAMAEEIQNRTKVTRMTIYEEGTIFILQTNNSCILKF